MKEQQNHNHRVEHQFGSQAQNYLTSTVHAQGKDLIQLAALLAPFPQARVIDVGCGQDMPASPPHRPSQRLSPMTCHLKCWRW